MKKNSFKKTLEKIINIPSITGQSSSIVDFLKGELEKLSLSPKVTNRQGILVSVPGKGKEEILVGAHYDTLGGMVAKIEDEGKIRFSKVGSYPWVSVLGAPCQIIAASGKIIEGRVIADKFSSHIYSDSEIESQKWSEAIYIRVDYSSTKLKNEVEIGDFIFFKPEFQVNEDYFSARHLDDKVSVAIIMELIRLFQEDGFKKNKPFGVYFTAQEEVGYGAKITGLEKYRYFLAVDIGIVGRGQESEEEKVTICVKDSVFPYDREMISELKQIASRREIPYKLDIFKHYGSDAMALLGSGYDIKVGLIGPGVRETHSWERTHWKGIKATFELLKGYLTI